MHSPTIIRRPADRLWMNRRAFLQTTAVASGFGLLLRPATARQSDSHDPDSALDQAREGIRRYRQDQRLIRVINDTWRTRVHGRTDRRGGFRLRAFHGHYTVAALHPNGRRLERNVDWTPAAPRTTILRFPSFA